MKHWAWAGLAMLFKCSETQGPQVNIIYRVKEAEKNGIAVPGIFRNKECEYVREGIIDRVEMLGLQ